MQYTYRYLLLSFILTIILFTFAICCLYWDTEYNPETEKTWEELYPTLETGDIVLLTSHDYVSRVIRYFSKDIFSHCCMVIRLNGKVLLWESDMSEGFDHLRQAQFKDGGPHLFEASTKSNDYKGCYGQIFRLKTIRPNIHHLLKYLEQYKKYYFDTNYFRWYCAYFKLDIFPTPKRLIFCTELISKTLQDFKILKNKYNPALYTFSDIYDNPTIFQKGRLFKFP